MAPPASLRIVLAAGPSLAVLFLAAASSAIAGSAAPVAVTVEGPERTISVGAAAPCDNSDLPDAPARAFRNAAGEMVLFAPNYPNRAFTGPDLAHLVKDCRVRFSAAGSADPLLLDDRTWLHAFHTDDGGNVFAFASASFIPYRHRMPCSAGTARTDCWRNGIAALTSKDGGRTFTYLGTPPGHIVFPPPPVYRDDLASPPGFMSTTNIVPWNGALYTILWRRDDAGRGENCLARSVGNDTRHWQVWNGHAFVDAAAFDGTAWSTATTDCAPIGPSGDPWIRGLVYHPASRTFIAVFQYRSGSDHGFAVATSTDLLTWSEPAMLWQADLAADVDADPHIGDSWVSYPAIIDSGSSDRNFATIGDTASLVFVRFVVSAVTPTRVTRHLATIAIRVTVRR
jgi:hypothetical protein